MNNKMVVAALVVLGLVIASCGDDSAAVSTDAFSDQLASVCRTIDRGIGNLDDATSLADVRTNANDASGLYEAGLNDLRKLKIPTSDQEFKGDVEDLIASFEDQLDTLDAIAKAARESDQEELDSRISKLTDQNADSNDLADSLEISRCQIDVAFEAAPTTEPPVPLTLPTVSSPSETFPLDTSPLDTVPFSNKVVVSSSDLVPVGDYTFADAPDGAITSFQTLIELSPLLAAQTGRIVGVDVLDLDGQEVGRVFAFESDTDPLTPGSLEEVTPYLTGDIATTPLTVGTLDGVTWTDPGDGTAYFLLGVGNVVLWALAPTAEQLVPALQAWGESISQ
jgi:hypothetical protein